MLSRVADAIYWMNRYVERAENVARFVDVNLHLALDFPEAHSEWEPLIATTGDASAYRERYGAATRDDVIRFLTFDRDNPNSICMCLSKARENARTMREFISSEVWEQVNRAYWMVTEASKSGAALDSPHDFFTNVKQASHLFVGTMYLTMTHNEGWHFGRLGRLLERADKTSRILDVKSHMVEPGREDVPTPSDELHWSALLRSASAFEMYRKAFGNVVPAKVIEFLLLDDRFPRSVLYCLKKSERSLHAITGTQSGRWTNRAERELGRLNAELAYAEMKEVLARGLHRFIDDLQLRMNHVNDSIAETFFAVAAHDEGRPRTLPPLSRAE
ncbi:MAG: alpha-E domain-containing protein [Polyangiaceae bacterium]|nr:alpha-E domain-containing protein [Polyangiaceae bacterium]